MFVDEIKVYFQGGRGGSGCASTLRQKYIARGGPDGGDGGCGGDVVLVATGNLNTLSSFTRQRHHRAENGKHGSSNNKFGAEGADRVVKVPLGTVVKTEEGETIADLLLEGERCVVAKGGRGGRGNAALATRAFPVPLHAEKGEPGEERWVVLELKLLADVGLIGFPNVGKSTLISRTSAARPKIAGYPFTTTTPHLGVVRVSNACAFVMADIPGLIEGAHEGRGLGTRFLRHVERCRLLVHVLDLSGWEGRDPVEDYRAIRRELGAYSPALAKKPEIVAGNKLDVTGADEALASVRKRLRKAVVGLSAATGDGVDRLVQTIAARLEQLPKTIARTEVTHHFEVEPEFRVARAGPGTFQVTGRRIETLVAMTDLTKDEAVEVLGRKLRRLGLEEELSRLGAEEGDTVRIGKYVFTFEPDS